MATYTFDTDEIIQRLRRHGLSEEAARDFVQAIRDAQRELVTTQQLQHALDVQARDLKIWTGGIAVLMFTALTAVKFFA
jgi:hypothetical protein